LEAVPENAGFENPDRVDDSLALSPDEYLKKERSFGIDSGGTTLVTATPRMILRRNLTDLK
jgi:hypothetical protein